MKTIHHQSQERELAGNAPPHGRTLGKGRSAIQRGIYLLRPSFECRAECKSFVSRIASWHNPLIHAVGVSSPDASTIDGGAFQDHVNAAVHVCGFEIEMGHFEPPFLRLGMSRSHGLKTSGSDAVINKEINISGVAK